MIAPRPPQLRFRATSRQVHMPEVSKASLDRPRIGAVSYLNSKPLIEGLAHRLAGDLLLDYPSRLASALSVGKLDVALIPSVEALRTGDAYEIVSDACVATGGPVRSVKVYFRVPPGEVKSLALDEGSRTSAALAQVLLNHKYGTVPDTVTLPLGDEISDSGADAILLIGDRAMFPVTEPFVETWDLGEEWWKWTGLPFVFAVWAGRQGKVPIELPGLLSVTRDAGIANIDEISSREAVSLGLDRALVHHYLTKNLHFTLGPAERSGLRLFQQLATQSGLISKGNDVVIHDLASEAGDRNIQPSDTNSAGHRAAKQHLISAR